MQAIELFLHNLLINGLEHYRKYYGIYRGQVMRNDDPEGRGRIQVLVPSVGHRVDSYPPVWVDPAFEGAGSNRGSFWPPEVGDSVRVSFEQGDPGKPIVYFGGWYGTTDLPPEFAYTGTSPNAVPEKRGFVTRMGHSLVFDDTKDREFVTLTWHQASASDEAVSDRSKSASRSTGKSSTFKMDKDGSIEIVNANGSKMLFDAVNAKIAVTDENGNSFVLENGKVTVSTEGEIVLSGGTCKVEADQIELGKEPDTQAVRGRNLVQWLIQHTHGSAMGPTAPPVTQPPADVLSEVVHLR